MKRLGWLGVGVSFVAAVAFAVVACVDLSPVIYDADASPFYSDAADDVSDLDGGPANADSGPTCVSCLTLPDDASPPGCGTEVAACVANAECSVIYTCAIAHHCFEQPSFRDIVNCGVPCVVASGVSTSTDPAIGLIYGIAVCAQASCNGPCHIGDAAIGGD
jgi:hypothetical protein